MASARKQRCIGNLLQPHKAATVSSPRGCPLPPLQSDAANLQRIILLSSLICDLLVAEQSSTVLVTMLLAAGASALRDWAPPTVGRRTVGTVGPRTIATLGTRAPPVTSDLPRGCRYDSGPMEGQVAAVGTGWQQDDCTACTCVSTFQWQCRSQMCEMPL